MKETDDYGRVSKENRRANQEADKTREKIHPFKFHPHEVDKKARERKRHQAERRALRRK